MVRLSGLRLRCGLAFRPLSLRNGSTSTLRTGGSALLPLTANTIISSVVDVTVNALPLFLCHRALLVRNVWATTGQAPRGLTTITLRGTKALTGFRMYGFLGSRVGINCPSETTERCQSARLADKQPASYRHYEVRCGELVHCRFEIAALRVELKHGLKRNSGDFQLFPEVLLGHVLA